MRTDRPYRTSCLPSDGGFTLIEVLVVLSVLGLLAAILLPTVQVIRLHAGGTACASIMRQCAAGHMAYAMENRGCVPYTYSGLPNDGSWPYLIKQYTARTVTDSTGTGGPPAGRRAPAARISRRNTRLRSIPNSIWPMAVWPGMRTWWPASPIPSPPCP